MASAVEDGGYLKTPPQRYSCGIGISGSLCGIWRGEGRAARAASAVSISAKPSYNPRLLQKGSTMPSFGNDYLSGCHPAILERLIHSNLEQTPGYGLDPYC